MDTNLDYRYALIFSIIFVIAGSVLYFAFHLTWWLAILIAFGIAITAAIFAFEAWVDRHDLIGMILGRSEEE